MMTRRRERLSFIDTQALRDLLNERPCRSGEMLAIIDETCHLRIGNGQPCVGRSKVVATLCAFLDRSEGLGATFWDCGYDGITLYVETEMRMRGVADLPYGLPCIVIRPLDRPFQDIRFYVDLAPISA
jgi:hypothetical protein